jgi:phosphatidylglycerophosphate synthase
MQQTRYESADRESVVEHRRVLFRVSPHRAMPYLVPAPTSRAQPTTRIERWSLANAVAVLLAAVGAVWLRTLAPLFLVGGAMLGLLVVVKRGRWTPKDSFGAANVVTAARIGLLGLLLPAASVHPGALIALSLLILALDGLDGWLARRRGLSSEFGAFFDKESDALFLLLLCGIAAAQGALPAWILGAGLLRYGFVVLVFLLPTPQNRETRSTLARYVYGCMVCALLLSFLPYPSLYRPVVAVATAALVTSFGQSLWGIVAPQWAFGEP